jgi:hypothetical protein
MVVRSAARCRAAVVAVTLVLAAMPVEAQRRNQEFTQQSILVANFWVRGKDGKLPSTARNDLRLGKEVGDWMRNRLKDLVNKRESKVIEGFDVREAIVRAGYAPDFPFDLQELRQQGEQFRTDEILRGVATRLPNDGLRLDAELVLYRDIRMRQPIEPVIGTSFDRAVEELAKRVNAARVQLVHQRRCENSLRDGQGQRAIQHARHWRARA